MREAFVRSLRGAVVVLALAGIPAAVITVAGAGEAGADVCTNVGRRVSVGGCVNVAGAIADYAPPPGYYAPLPEDYPPPPAPNVNGCVGWNGRWVHANGCTP
jgi:hypothetical protein